MTPKDHPVWNKMAVSTLDILSDVLIEIRRRKRCHALNRSRFAEVLQVRSSKTRYSSNSSCEDELIDQDLNFLRKL